MALPLDRKVIEIYARKKVEVQANGHIVGEFDRLIAATALANQLTAATLNVRDFAKVPGLQYEDWS